MKVTADTYSQADALLIPYDAVYYDDSQPYVYVAENGLARRKDVETGIFDMDTITVLSGLSTEDVLITSWSANLREGAEVSVQMKTADAADGEQETSPRHRVYRSCPPLVSVPPAVYCECPHSHRR